MYLSSFCIFCFQEDYKKMEVYAFEKDTQIISLEEELAALYREKGVLSSNEGLHSEIKSLSEMLNTSDFKLNELQQEVLALVSWSSFIFFIYLFFFFNHFHFKE